MAIPSMENLMLPVLRLCATGELSVGDMVPQIITILSITAEDAAMQIPSGRGMATIAKRTQWTVFYLKNSGLLTRPRRGMYMITELGRGLLAKHPTRIDLDTLMTDPDFRAFRQRGTADSAGRDVSSVPTAIQVAAPEERIAQATAEMDAELRSKLLEAILAAPPSFFEHLIVDLLIAMGYGGSRADAGETLGQSGDGGVDGVIREDRLGLDRIYLQAKRYQSSNKIGSPAMQGFVGALHGQGANKGVFITTSDFTPDARAFTDKLGGMRVVLINGDTLTRLMLQHGVGVRTQETVAIRRLDTDYFNDDVDTA